MEWEEGMTTKLETLFSGKESRSVAPKTTGFLSLSIGGISTGKGTSAVEVERVARREAGEKGVVVKDEEEEDEERGLTDGEDGWVVTDRCLLSGSPNASGATNEMGGKGADCD